MGFRTRTALIGPTALMTTIMSLLLVGSTASAQPAQPQPPHPLTPEPPAADPYADPPPTTTGPSGGDEARRALDAALNAEAAGAAKEACVWYRKSLALVRELGPLRKVASCDAREGKLLAAEAALVELLRRLPEGDVDRGLLLSQLDAVIKRLAHVKIGLLPGAPPQMAVRVDGAAVVVPLEDLRLDPGHHEVIIDLPGKPAQIIPFDLAEGSSTSIDVPVSGGPPPVVVLPPPERVRGLWIAGWAVGGVGLAGFVVAGVTGAKLIGDQSEFDECVATPGCDSQAIADSADTLLAGNAIAWGIGAVGVSVGATLLIVDAVQVGKTKDVTVEARVGPSNASLLVRF